MTIRMKYVIIDAAFPVLFAGNIEHKNMSVHGKITSAGFCHIQDGKIWCNGSSHSLNDMGPGELDDNIIASYLGLQERVS
jgi:hypothetical protein